jgi:hypothetical protein
MSGPNCLSRLLVVQPDSLQADALREALHGLAAEDVVVAESLDDALSSIDQCVPDVVLLPTLIPATVENYLIAYLGTIPNAGHVQILGLPRLERSDDSVERQARFAWRRLQGPHVVGTPGCDPGVFAQDVTFYLASARERKMECAAYSALSGKSERRGERRFASNEVPWISYVSFGGERVGLINVSSGGALLRTRSRPEHHFLRRSDPNVLDRSCLTLELRSDSKVHAMGRVVRCVPLRTSALTEYEIAFSFDHTVGLDLPAADTLVPVSRTSTESSVQRFERGGDSLAGIFRELWEAVERS